MTGSGGAYHLAIAIGDVNGDGVDDVVNAGYDSSFGVGLISVALTRTNPGIGALAPFSLRSRAETLQFMPYLDATLNRLTSQRGVIGAFQARLESALANVRSSSDNLIAAASRIEDTDVAADSSNLIRTQILQQASSAVLAQANQAPALALSLLAA